MPDTYTLRTRNDGRVGVLRAGRDYMLASYVLGFLAAVADDGYVNEECPALCSTPHEWPVGRDEEITIPVTRWNHARGQYVNDGTRQVWSEVPRCPETGAFYEWCDLCEAWNEQTHHYRETYYYEGHGDVCNLGDHGLFCCDGCERVLDDDDYGSDGYCQRCEREYSEEYEDEGGRHGRCDGEPVTVCLDCATENRHVHSMTEEYLCDHRAMEHHLAGVTVLFFDHGPADKFLSLLKVA